MKKLITIMLSAIIVITSLTCMFIAPASAAVNLWSGLSANDWYTRQVHSEVSDPLTLEEKQMTDVYPEKFTYGGGSFSLSSAGSKHYYVKMPVLATNKDYTVSFKYSVTTSSGTPTFHKAILMPQSALTNPVAWNGYGAMMTGRGFLGAYDIFVNKALAENEHSGTVTYTFNTKKDTQYYLFLGFNNIDTVTYSNFKVVDPTDTTPEEEVNPADVWTNVSTDDWRTRHVHTPADDGRNIPEKSMAENYGDDFTYDAKTDSFTLEKAHGRHYFVKMPKLTKNKDYKLSVKYSVDPGTNTEPMFYKSLLVPESAFTSEYCWNKYGEIYADRAWIGIQNVLIKKSLKTENSGTLTYDFNTGKYDQYYLFLMFNQIESVTYSDFQIIDPELVEEEPENPGDDTEEPDEPITVLPEDAADIWTEYSINDWFTKQTTESYTDGRDIPEKTAAEKYGSDFSYNAESKSFKLKNAHDRYYYVKLPKMELAKNYTLSFDYLATLNENTDGIFQKAILVPKAQFNNQFCWNTYGEVWSDRAFVDIIDIVGGNDDGLAPGGITLTDENRNSNLKFDFNSGKYDEYYLFLKFKNIKTITYYNLSLIDPTLKPDYKGNPLNYGSITPATLPEGTKAGDTVIFTANPFKGNTFEGWYDGFGNLITTEKTFTYTVPASLEMPVPSFNQGAVAVPNAGLEDSAKGLLAYYNKSDNFNKTIIDANYDVEYIGTPTWEVNIQAHEAYAHTGTKSVKIQTPYAYSGRHFTGLKENTDYAVSFWAYIDASASGLSLNAMVLPKGVKPYKENSAGKIADYPLKEAMGVAERAATATSKWQEIVVKFNSGENTDITLWFLSRGANSDRCWVDDFTIFEPVTFNVTADLGGSVTATQSGTLAKDTEITVTATPDKGNNFKHWVDADGMVVSTDAEYTFTITEDAYLKAVFGGYNKPARELFALRGDDGTFENGAISGIYAADVTYPDSLGHCKTQVTTAEAYEGEKSLEIFSYYRNTIIPLTGLNKNTDYRFSYYVKYPYKGERDDWNQINSMMICGADDIDGETANKIFAKSTSYLAGDAGWYKVELYFNSGENTAANFIIRYAGEPKLSPAIYMDNVELYEYYSSNELANGNMTNDIAPWLGDGEISADTLKLSGKNATAYQLLGLGTHGRYTVKFRAKGNIFASVSNVSAKVPDIYNAISSESYATGNSTGFKNYSFEVYTGIHKGVALMFSSLGGEAYVDNVTITKQLSPIGGVIENVDFETDRFALTHTNKDFYEIYTAKSAKDKNVHSGKKSLHFKYNAKQSDVEAILDEAYLSYGVNYNHNYMLTLYYKFAGVGKEAAVNLEPNYRASYFNGDYGDYSGTIGYSQPTTKGGWKQLRFVFTAGDYGVLKTAIYNIIGKTDADFYVDDIKITVSSDLVVDEKTTKSYTTDFYNMFTNPSFEKSASAGNWTAMPKTMQIVNNRKLADTANKFLMVSEGTKYILPIKLNPSEVYYFGASIRSFNGGKGRIYLATLTSPTTLYFTDLENNPKSIITADSAKWKHEGFGFRSSPTGETYMVVECTEGSIGIDTVSLTLEKHANDADYNYYYPHIPFDYSSIDPSYLVYNGGMDFYKADEYKSDYSVLEDLIGDDYEYEYYLDYGGTLDTSPSTGDSLVVVAIIGVTLAISAVTLLLTKKRKDEIDA